MYNDDDRQSMKDIFLVVTLIGYNIFPPTKSYSLLLSPSLFLSHSFTVASLFPVESTHCVVYTIRLINL